MRFTNIKTGNTVNVNNKATIALMQKSDRYKAVTTRGGNKAADKADKSDDKAEGEVTE